MFEIITDKCLRKENLQPPQILCYHNYIYNGDGDDLNENKNE